LSKRSSASLLDSGHIVREDNFWRATRAIEKVSIPGTLAGLLAARIDALPDDAKRVAQMSAVIGRSFAFRVIEAICAAAPAAERIAASRRRSTCWLARRLCGCRRPNRSSHTRSSTRSLKRRL
jgi:predicted ATPase